MKYEVYIVHTVPTRQHGDDLEGGSFDLLVLAGVKYGETTNRPHPSNLGGRTLIMGTVRQT